jgi:hypothetical protein
MMGCHALSGRNGKWAAQKNGIFFSNLNQGFELKSNRFKHFQTKFELDSK